jgi:hypothetical protein
MNRISTVILLLIFLVLAANFFQPFFFPVVRAEEPYQVAVLKGRLKASMMRVEEEIKKLEQKVNNHTHITEIYECDPFVSREEVETSKPE